MDYSGSATWPRLPWSGRPGLDAAARVHLRLRGSRFPGQRRRASSPARSPSCSAAPARSARRWQTPRRQVPSARSMMNQGNGDPVANADRYELFAGTLGGPVGIPAVSVSYFPGEEFANTPGLSLRIEADTISTIRSTSNVFAQTQDRSHRQRRDGGGPSGLRAGHHRHQRQRVRLCRAARDRPARWRRSRRPTRSGSPGGVRRRPGCRARTSTSTASPTTRSMTSRFT